MISTGINAAFSARQQERAAEYASAQALQNAEIQRSLWENQLREGAARQVSGMKSAGLNPAMMQGGMPGTPPLSSSPGTPIGANPVQSPDIGTLLNDSARLDNETKMNNVNVKRGEIENKFLPEQLQLGLDKAAEELGLLGDERAKIQQETINLGYEGANLLNQFFLISEQITASQWNRVTNRLQLYINAALADADIDLKTEQKNQLVQLTPALVYQAMQQGNLNAALAKVAGIVGDPKKAFGILKEWIASIDEELPKVIESLKGAGGNIFGKIYQDLKELRRGVAKEYAKLRGNGAHEAFVQQEGSSGGSRPPMQWRPRWNGD